MRNYYKSEVFRFRGYSSGGVDSRALEGSANIRIKRIRSAGVAFGRFPGPSPAQPRRDGTDDLIAIHAEPISESGDSAFVDRDEPADAAANGTEPGTSTFA